MASISGNNIATGQVSVGTTATLIAPARPDRKRLTILNGATAFEIGGPAVMTGNGGIVPANGQPLVLETTAAIYGIVATGTAAVSFIDEFA